MFGHVTQTASAICTFSFRFPAVFGGFWVSRNLKTRNLETLKESLENIQKLLVVLKLLIFYLLDMWGFWEMRPGFPSFPVSWFLLVFIGFWGSETSRNQNAGLLMYVRTSSIFQIPSFEWLNLSLCCCYFVFMSLVRYFIAVIKTMLYEHTVSHVKTQERLRQSVSNHPKKQWYWILVVVDGLRLQVNSPKR